MPPPQFTPVRPVPSSQSAPTDHAHSELLESIKCFMADQEKLHIARYEEMERLNKERYEEMERLNKERHDAIMAANSESEFLNRERNVALMEKLDVLIDILRPVHAHFSGCEDPQDTPSNAHANFEDRFTTPQGEHNIDSAPKVTNMAAQPSRDAITTPSHSPAHTYETPPSIIYEGVGNEEPGDEVEQVVRDGRPLRLRKRARNLLSPFISWPKKRRYSKLEPPTFNPFRLPIEEDVQAFYRWYNGDTCGRPVIRCGLLFRERSFFETLLAKQQHIDSEHVDEITYIFRKRMDKFQDIFPQDRCILTDEFGKYVRELYCKSRETSTVVYKKSPQLMSFVDAIRPIRGRAWSKVNYFYVPWNNNNKHWMALVVDIRMWTIWIYNSNPDYWISIEAMERSVQPLAEYFPLLLRDSGHFNEFRAQCKYFMKIEVAPTNTVPQSNRMGDCGIFMLKTIEMHIAGKCNESARTLLNDDNIDTFRQAYAVQLYVGSADP
ncbi:uncharacterized protein LOC133791163 [Humulus lupulus]|uniref:uncharacterized protein LOC133791163 n=1 Tax=Humulus lupulus TaxID=3486 RepID=UPI002B40FCB0|nr:uncharacterized protein LOC133791163 [Humulus lupulus]